MLNVEANNITEASMPSWFTKTTGAPRTRGSADPPVVALCRSSRLAPSQPAIVAQEKTPANAQPKHRGRPPKPGKCLSSLSFLLLLTYVCVLVPVVFRDPVVFDKNRFSKPSAFVFLSEYFSKTFLEHIVDCFGLDKLPVILKNPQPHVSLIFNSLSFSKILTSFYSDARAILQCSMCKDEVVKNCTFHRWGTPCGPCDVLHVSSCEYYLHATHWGKARDLIRWRVAIHVPSGKLLLYSLYFKVFLLTYWSF